MSSASAVPAAQRIWPPLRLVALALGVAVVVVLFLQFGVDSLVDAFRRIDPLILALSLAVGAGVRLAYALRWRAIAAVIGVRAPLSRFVQARLAGDALGTVLPTGKISGDPLRVVLLRKKGGRVALPTTSVALDRFMEFIGNTFCAIGSVTVFAVSRAAIDASSWMFELAIIGMLATWIVPLALLRRGKRPFQPLYLLEPFLPSVRLQRWFALLYETETQLIEFFRDHQRAFAAGALGSVLIELMILVEYRLYLTAFGIYLDWPTLMMVVVTGGLARAVPIPGGLGAVEASQVGLLAVAAGDARLGFLVGIVLRLYEAFWLLIGFGGLLMSGRGARAQLLNAAGKPSE